MTQSAPLVRIKVPIGRQEIELSEIVFVEQAMPLLRVRIREDKRFTIFDIDADSAIAWGEAMLRWGRLQKDGCGQGAE